MFLKWYGLYDQIVASNVYVEPNVCDIKESPKDVLINIKSLIQQIRDNLSAFAAQTNQLLDQLQAKADSLEVDL